MSTIKTWRERYAERFNMPLREASEMQAPWAMQAEIDELRVALAEKSQRIATAECDVQVLMDAARLALGALERLNGCMGLAGWENDPAAIAGREAIEALKAAGVKTP